MTEALRIKQEATNSEAPGRLMRQEQFSSTWSDTGKFRPDAALLPLLPPEDHPEACECDGCTTDARLNSKD